MEGLMSFKVPMHIFLALMISVGIMPMATAQQAPPLLNVSSNPPRKLYQEVNTLGRDPKYRHLVKINPLAHWNKSQVWDYIQRYTVPINPLHAQGYPSIGCWPCTRPTGAGEDDRAGRWAGMMKRECGLHV